MKLRELEYADICDGNVLIVSCQGRRTDARHANGSCGGWIRIPFSPGINGAPAGTPTRRSDGTHGPIWSRTHGTTLDDLNLSPSINAGPCGHFHVKDGAITP